MIRPLGGTAQGRDRIAARAARIVIEYGECAVFLSMQTRQAYALSRTDPDWHSAMRKHAHHLVGVYQPVAA